MEDKIITVNTETVEQVCHEFIEEFGLPENVSIIKFKEEVLSIMNHVADKSSEEHDFLDDFYGFLNGGNDEG